MRNCMTPQGHPTHCGCEPFEKPSVLKTTNVRYATSTQPAEADGVPTWRERILARNPKSDPQFWPDSLLVEHMQPEIEELRAAVTAVTAERERLRAELRKAPPEWAKMDPALVVEHLRHATAFDADKVEAMLDFAIGAAMAAKEGGK